MVTRGDLLIQMPQFMENSLYLGEFLCSYNLETLAGYPVVSSPANEVWGCQVEVGVEWYDCEPQNCLYIYIA